jgi:hypothetical protein
MAAVESVKGSPRVLASPMSAMLESRAIMGHVRAALPPQ